MGQCYSLFAPCEDCPSYEQPETVLEMEDWFGESFVERTNRLSQSMTRVRQQQASPSLAKIPAAHREAFVNALDNAWKECQEQDWRSEWWLYRFWHIIEWSAEDKYQRHISLSTLDYFDTLIEWRNEKALESPWLVVQEYMVELRLLVHSPDFALSEWLIHAFAQWLRCRDIPDMPPRLEYMLENFQWKPIENPQTAIESSIANLPRKCVENLIESEEVGECGICRDEVENGTEVTVLQPFCCHWFHTGCIHYVLLNQGIGPMLCPACRVQIALKED